jgi:gluconate 2-dehydrogenase gamma chain
MSKESSSKNLSENNPSSETADTNRRQFLKYAAVGAVGVGIASAVEIPVLSNMVKAEDIKLQEANTKIDQLNSTVQQDQTQINNLTSQVSDLQSQLAGNQGLSVLNIDEQKVLEAIVETIIPTDSNGPGAKEAGVIYFIDKQLGGDYGTNARMYMKGPFVLSGQAGPLTVDGINYPQGSPSEPYSGPTYQYNMSLRDFWRYGLEALENYATKAYGDRFENLSNTQKIEVLTEIYDNKPTDFNDIVPNDFFNELIFMTYSGFFMDPLYGGNIGMVGWKLTGFSGANMGDTFNTGRDVKALMVADKPTRYSPHSLGEYQKTLNLIGGT